MKTLKKISIKNMSSGNNNKPIANQVVITTPDGVYFRSYKTIIAFIPNDGGQTLLDPDWTFSVTTGKYRNQFLRETRKETEKKIKSGEYIIANLN